ncbi:hypothetical protein BN7_5527 [Wickerhamomyces ciferrii]|uniref:Conserved oligomeric Golgi complex subunit 8 n=1 Tax=Wickerhamomyces ciferrii (strain ATCC 14091 / BCRC 22168 / CBS 111 / JCM 3599 / NBRC 0793 / NRRL Y-1031 F-60-10) TaxID=1206466 RepID=K0KL28_WICCF|nr:uncharacterized protein BN7_5527 [Wickerhamomyces ciferrii]CCH45940.1 hypothetical protein BN7_5527 [Wickerhamomyces ciferrii]
MVDNGEVIDESALDVLLQELSEDLPADVKSLLDRPEMHTQMLQYLNEISSIGSNDYLSSVPPTPAANSDLNALEERTLVQDIAELEAKQRAIDNNLKSLITKSQSSIIDNEIGLKQAYSSFEQEFVHDTKALWRSFRDDDISDFKDDQELHELEIDLDPNSKQDSFQQTIENIKNIQPSEVEKNKNLSVVLQNMDQIVVILELPSLAGACIKAGYYSEALEISSYTRRLAIRFPQSDLIKEVETAVQSEMSLMLTGLIRLLRTNLKQSSIIKISSYLRRIQPFSQSEAIDEQLKRILLHSRYQFIQIELESLKPLKQSELFEKYCKRSIEVIREHCFGSIMTYRNIFPDSNELEVDLVDVGKIIEEEDDEQVDEISKKTEDIELEDNIEIKQEQNEETLARDTSEITPNGIETNNKDQKDDKEVEDSNKDEAEEGSGGKTTKSEAKAITEEPNLEGEPREEVTENESNEEQITNTNSGSNSNSNSNTTPIIPLIKNGKKSNILLFEFVQNVLLELVKNLQSSILQINEKSIRDGLYLQLIYCSQSLGRIDENFSDLMTITLLNTKNEETQEFIIDRPAWIKSIFKQQHLAKTLNR